MKSRSRRRTAALRAEELETALDTHQVSHPRTEALVNTAALLRPVETGVETQRDAIKARMLRAAQIEFSDTPGRKDAGTRDKHEVDVHTALVDLPDGRVFLADLDRLDPDRAQEVAEQIVALDRGQTER